MKALQSIQQELKAPKGQYNSFGKYKYRSAEDILEAVKPLLGKYSAQLTLSDNIKEIGGRVYVEATATFTDGTDTVTVTAFAREPVEKRGMDDSQITGTASSYARKYALNGLFLIDDTKDADSDEYAKQTSEEPKQEPKQSKSKTNKPAQTAPANFAPITAEKSFIIDGLIEMTGTDRAKLLDWYGVKSIDDMTDLMADDCITQLRKKPTLNG